MSKKAKEKAKKEVEKDFEKKRREMLRKRFGDKPAGEVKPMSKHELDTWFTYMCDPSTLEKNKDTLGRLIYREVNLTDVSSLIMNYTANAVQPYHEGNINNLLTQYIIKRELNLSDEKIKQYRDDFIKEFEEALDEAEDNVEDMKELYNNQVEDKDEDTPDDTDEDTPDDTDEEEQDKPKDKGED